MQNRMTEQKGAGNGKREEKEGNDCGNGLNDILVPFMVYYPVSYTHLKDVSMIRLDDKRFVVNVEVAVSRQFLAWIISLGEGVTLVGPDNVVEMMNIEIDRLIKQYKK